MFRCFVRWARAQDGTATIEFAILLPALILFFISLIWVGIYYLTVGSVWQLTQEVARQSLQYRFQPLSSAEFCQRVDQDLVPYLAGSFELIDVNRLEHIQCLEGSDGDTIISLQYDASAMKLAQLLAPQRDGRAVITARAHVFGGKTHVR